MIGRAANEQTEDERKRQEGKKEQTVGGGESKQVASQGPSSRVVEAAGTHKPPPGRGSLIKDKH